MSIDTLNLGPDAATALAEADAARPDEPSLPLGQWAKKNLFSSIGNTILTIVFAAITIFAYRGVLNFVFSEERSWNAVRVNMRNLFTASYPGSQYNRIWVTLGVVLVLTGLSMGLMKTIGRGFSVKRISMWFMSTGGAIVAGILLREPSALKDQDGEVMRETVVQVVRDNFGDTTAGRGWWWLIAVVILAAGVYLHSRPDRTRSIAGTSVISVASAGIAALIVVPGPQRIDRNGEPVFEEVSNVVRESRLDAMADRGLWWIAGLLALAVGLGLWFGLGDKRRRTTFVPAIPLGLGMIGAFISSVWWFKWGHYGKNDALELVIEPGRLVASTTRIPFTILWFVLVGAYLVGLQIFKTEHAGRVRAILSLSWLLAPFVTFFVILRDPDLDWAHVWSTDLPMALGFIILGGALLWALTNPAIGERGRLIGVALLGFAIFNWVAAFFGWYAMLQKARISFLLIALVALAAHNFAGDARQRMRMVWGWVGLMVVVHYLITMINTVATVAAPDEFAGGFVVTVYIATFTMIFSFPLGVILALGRTSSMPLFRVMSTTYIEVVRGIPFITILFFFAVFVKFFLPEGMELEGLAAAGIGFTLFSAAYLAENIRGGLQSIRRGQYEASDAMGLTTVQRTGFIILPQALRASIPVLVGAVIATFKETALLSIVGIIDFLRVANNSIPGQTEFVGIKREGLLFVSLVYWIISYAMSKYSQRLERQLGVGER